MGVHDGPEYAENQLYDTFTGVGAVTEKNVRAKSRVHRSGVRW